MGVGFFPDIGEKAFWSREERLERLSSTVLSIVGGCTVLSISDKTHTKRAGFANTFYIVLWYLCNCYTIGNGSSSWQSRFLRNR